MRPRARSTSRVHTGSLPCLPLWPGPDTERAGACLGGRGLCEAVVGEGVSASEAHAAFLCVRAAPLASFQGKVPEHVKRSSCVSCVYVFWKQLPREVALASAGLDMCEPGWAVRGPPVPHLRVPTPDCQALPGTGPPCVRESASRQCLVKAAVLLHELRGSV